MEEREMSTVEVYHEHEWENVSRQCSASCWQIPILSDAIEALMKSLVQVYHRPIHCIRDVKDEKQEKRTLPSNGAQLE